MRTPFQLNRRTRRYLHCATGVLSLFVWLFMATAEICPPLHAWLHGGAIPDDDDCPVVAIATGHVHVGVCEVQPLAPVTRIEITPRPPIIVFVASEKVLTNDRAPPASLV
jgi:hypothetical protein